MNQINTKFIYVVLVFLLASLTACNRGAPWQTKNISGLMPTLAFNMTEANRDLPVTASDYRGHFLLMYFGYTHCPDVCPLTLGRLKAAIARLGDDADLLRVLFVTIDPSRDKLPELKRYVGFFGPQFIGLRGSEAEMRALTKKYRVTYGYDKPDAHGNYNVSHSSAVYVFDTQGEARLLFRPTDKIDAMVADLKRLIAHQNKPHK